MRFFFLSTQGEKCKRLFNKKNQNGCNLHQIPYNPSLLYVVVALVDVSKAVWTTIRAAGWHQWTSTSWRVRL
jgi:hypothetical protein